MRRRARAVRHLAHQDVAGNVGKAEIREDDVELAAPDEIGGFASGAHCGDVGALGAQENHEGVTNVGYVLDHEHAQAGQAAGDV